jgi:hypothetical protein
MAFAWCFFLSMVASSDQYDESAAKRARRDKVPEWPRDGARKAGQALAAGQADMLVLGWADETWSWRRALKSRRC